MSQKIKNLLVKNVVTIVFVLLCIFGIVASEQPLPFIVKELITRIGRNSFLVLSLIIPVIAGMGLNFGITIGAMAAQIVMIFAISYGATGFSGLVLCIVLSTPLAALFGYITGRVLNKTIGQEMITSMIMGFFANGLYQLLFLFLIGTVLPIGNENFLIPGGVGIVNTIDLKDNVMYAVDNVWTIKLPMFLGIFGAIGALATGYLVNKYKKSENKILRSRLFFYLGLSISTIVVAIVLQSTVNLYKLFEIPMITFAFIAVIGAFNVLIFKTKMGHDFRTVGQDKHIAHVSGINVEKRRILSIMISTILAAWGQIIFLQNLGTLNTYGSHVQISTFAIAALLIGGASVSKATVGQALLGVILFHTLFIVSPMAGKNLFGNAQVGEYFRTFIAYGVIGLSLGLHAWKTFKAQQQKDKVDIN
ncbi:MAG: ABC transporter permease [Clostridiales bacterium]|jgi:simple sugar transport system permease protein|nr:ABC transporter permease [Clostridiales bacterium]